MFNFIKFTTGSEQVMCEVIKSEKYIKAYQIPDVEFKNMIGGMKYRDIKLGDGAEVVQGSVVNVQFTGRLLGGREIETTNHLSGGTLVVEAGGSGVVKCVSEGIIGMREYGSRELLVPPSMHYPDRFPAHQIMVYEILVRTLVR